MALTAKALLKQLDNLKDRFGGGEVRTKIDLIDRIARSRLGSAKEVIDFHDALCFLRAFPDDAELLARVEGTLGAFGARKDLARFRKELADTGIAGTEINYPFFWFTAAWLARHWPDQLSVDWKEFDRKERLEKILHLLVAYCETPALDEIGYSLREWIDHLKGPSETDAAFLIKRFGALKNDSFGTETVYEDIDVPLRLAPGPASPSRTHEKYAPATISYQTEPLSRARPKIVGDVKRPPEAVTVLPPREGQHLIDLARGAMVTRSRDLDVFVHGDKRDVRLIDCGEGLQFACFSAVPERRLLLEAVYGLLTIKNGIPAGYVLISSLFGSSAIAYNVFDTFRGADSARVYGRILSIAHNVFGADTFIVDPYQLGHNNPEGLHSGAWWFYYKLGFRPHDAGVRRVLKEELARKKANPRHRSTIATLQQLTAENMYFYLKKPRADVLGRFSVGNVGLAVSRYLSERFGADRERGLRTCARDAARLLGVRSLGPFSPGERLAWSRWSPLVLTLRNVKRWGPARKKSLVALIRAKGGVRESDFVTRFDGHRLLRKAILELAGDG